MNPPCSIDGGDANGIMKKKAVFLSLALLCGALSACQSPTNQFQVDDFVYESQENGTCALVSYQGKGKDTVSIPQKAKGKVVVSIGSEGGKQAVFKGHSEIHTIHLPKTIHYLGAESFRGTGLNKIYLPERLTYVGADCFRDCSSLAFIACASQGAFMHYGWDEAWNSGGVEVHWGEKENVVGGAVAFIAENVAKGFVSSAAGMVAETAINSMLSLFGYESPEDRFQEEVQQGIAADESSIYNGVSKKRKHQKVNHSAKVFVDGMASTNGIESVWAVLKRMFYGTYHQFSKKHLQRYVDECTFRLNQGSCKVHIWDRMNSIITGSFCNHITYRGLVA